MTINSDLEAIRSSSPPSEINGLSTSSSGSVDADVYCELAVDIKNLKLPVEELEGAMSRAERLIKWLQNDDKFNTFVVHNSSVTQKLDRVLSAMLSCAMDRDAKVYAIKAILVCGNRANNLNDRQKRHTLLLGNLRSLDHPSNAMLLGHDEHLHFDSYNFCLRPYRPTDVDPPVPGCYQVEFFNNDRLRSWTLLRRGDASQPVLIHFKDHSNQPNHINIPDPCFLAIHAAVAGVLNMSGASRFFDDLLDQFPPPSRFTSPISWTDMQDLVQAQMLGQQLSSLQVTAVSA